MEQNIIGTTIAALRREKGLTQDALAAQLGVSAQAVSKWENGLSCPDILMLPEIAEYFGVSVDALFGRASVSAEVSAAPAPAGTASSAHSAAREVIFRNRFMCFFLLQNMLCHRL